MTTRKNFCDTLIQSKELKEFIEANSNLTPEEIVKMFKNKTKEQRERLVVNRQADLRLIEEINRQKESIKKLGKEQSEVATNRASATIDTSDVGLLRNLIINSSGVWYAGAGNSLEIKQQSYISKYTNLLNGELELLDVRVVNNGNLNAGRYDFSTPQGDLFDKQVRIEWGILNGTGDKTTGNIKAKETAKALNDITQGMIKDEQALGLKTGIRQKYAGMQTHNQQKISNVSQKEYWDFTLKLLTDEQRIAFEGKKEITQNIYEILAGRNTKEFSIEGLPLKSKESIENFVNTRSLEFKDVNAEIEYHRKFGDTADIIDITFASINRQAKAMASFEMFGFQKPQVAIEKAVNYIWDNNLTQEQKDKLKNKANFGLKDIQARLNADVEEVLLGTRLPEFTQKIMKYQGARTLTGTLMNQFGADIVMQKLQKALRTGNVSRSLVEGVATLPTAPLRIFKTIYKAWSQGKRAGLSKQEFYEASLHGYLSEAMVRQAHDFIAKNGVFEVKKAGKFDSFVNWVHRYAGNTADNQLKQIAIKSSLTKEFRDFANGNFKGDSEVYKDFLRLYFTDNEINTITKVKEAREGDGIHGSDMQYLKNEDVKDLVKEDISKIELTFNAERKSVAEQIKNIEKQVLEAEALKTGILKEKRNQISKNIEDLESRLERKTNEFVKNKIAQAEKDLSLADDYKKLQNKLNEEKKIEIENKIQKLKEELDIFENKLKEKKGKRGGKLPPSQYEAIKLKSLKDKIKIEQSKLEKEKFFYSREDYSKLKSLEQKFKSGEKNLDKIEEGKIFFTEYERRQLKFIKEQINTEKRKIESDEMPFLNKEDFKKVKEADETIKKFGKLKENYQKQSDALKKDLKEKEKNLYERKKIELEQKFSSMLIAETNRNLNIGGARVRSLARADGGQITSAGALFMQLKTASISQYFDLYQRILTHPHFSNMGKLGFFTASVGFLTLAGMMTVMLTDSVNNWGEPKKRSLSEILHEGFMRGGAGGIIYDAVKSLYGRELGGIFFDERISDRGKIGDIASFVAGPTGGQVADILQATQDLIPQGKDKKVKIDKALEVSIKSIPATNLFYYRALTNHTIMGIGEVIQDLSGGKIESKKKKNKRRREAGEEGLFSDKSPRITFANYF